MLPGVSRIPAGYTFRAAREIVMIQIADFLELFLNSRRRRRRRDDENSGSSRTADWYRQQLGVWFDWLEENQADPLGADELDAFLLDQADENLSDSTIHARYRSIRAFLRFLSKRRKIAVRMDDLPTALIEAPEIAETKPRVADPVDVQRVIDSLTPALTWLDYRDKCMIELMRSTGLRVMECVNLRIGHVNVTEGYVFVQGGKGLKDRVVPFGKNFSTAFTGYLFNRPAIASDLLFLGADTHAQGIGAMTENSVRQMIRRRCEVAQVGYFNPHSVRHMFSVQSLNAGLQLSALSAMLGHSSVAFTAKVYARWIFSGLRRQYDENVERL